MNFDWKSLLANVAPVIGSAIGGPFGALAGAAVKAVLGLGEDADEAAIAKGLEKATPEQLISLKQAEKQFVLDLERLGIDREKLAAEDRASARAREIALRDLAPRILALVIVAGWIGLSWLVFSHDLPAANKDFILRTLGTVDAALMLVLAYYFGSSAGSARKTEQLDALAKTGGRP
jgi:hypothetical protein